MLIAMDELVERLAAWVGAHHGRAHELTRGATGLEIAAVEQRLGVSFPEGLRALYRWTGAGTEGGPAIMNNRHVVALDTLAETREMLNGYVADGTFHRKGWWHEAWVPFLSNGASSYLCWDPKGSFAEYGGVRGQILEYWNKDPDRNIVAPGFDTWLTLFVESLEEGVWTYDPTGWNVDDEPSFTRYVARRYPTYPKTAIALGDKRAPLSPPALGAVLTKPVRAYSASSSFTLGERIAHPKFGEGVVQAVNAPGKVTIQFVDQRRVLVAKR
ncbi:MAG: SMI1/KNR4 family protein [Deltaproteobacteria bacterium]|nr:SMI1/KNR4 family protein [Deltaproteobacteria bacterium]